MKFGVYLPNMMHLAAVTQPWEHSVDAAGIVRVAELADELGYGMVPVPEHFVIPPAHVEFSGDHYFDATTVQAFLAGATSRITLGSVATILPLHHPIVLAKAIATLDWFSGGRALVTVGVGWLKEEFRALGVPFAKRGRLADEYLAAMFELWHSDALVRGGVRIVPRCHLRAQANSAAAPADLGRRRRRCRVAAGRPARRRLVSVAHDARAAVRPTRLPARPTGIRRSFVRGGATAWRC